MLLISYLIFLIEFDSAIRLPDYILRTSYAHEAHSFLGTSQQGWSDCVSFGDFSSYRDRFERIQAYFAPRFPEATRVGNEMIKTILEKTEKQ